MLKFNPELKKNLWLEFSNYRLIFAPAIVFLLVSLGQVTPFIKFDNIGYTIAALALFIWGTKNASSAVISEINANTWDLQRQSPLSATKIALGKLFGTTSYVWYLSLISLFLYSVIKLQNFPNLPDLFLEVSILILGAVFAHTLGLLISIARLPRFLSSKTISSSTSYLPAIIIAGLVTYQLLFLMKNNINQFDSNNIIFWFGKPFNIFMFFFVSTIIYLIWSLIGLKQTMQRVLQYTNLPFLWLGFNIFIVLYFVGFSSLNPELNLDKFNLPINIQKKITNLEDYKTWIKNIPELTAFYTSLIMVYLSLFTTEQTDLTFYQRFKLNLQSKNFLKVMLNLPAFGLSFIILLFILAYNIIFLNATSVVLISYTLYLIRDLFLLHLFVLNPKFKSPYGTFVLYLLILYYILPLLISGFGYTEYAFLVLPGYANDNGLLAIISALLQTLGIGLLVKALLNKKSF